MLYYLNARTQQEGGLQVMPRDQFYKNKPANLKRIESDRVWSYEVTDHYSGAIFVHYVMGAESATNLAESFIAAICQRPGDPFHGVPRILMMDMGSANTSGMFTNLARRLQVQVLAHAPGNARATGQVEKARDLIERGFESALRFRPVADLADLNTQAARWATWFNSHRVHTRHGKTRYDCWMGITSDQLRIAPPAELCQELLTHTPEERKVSVTLSVQFKGAEYDVRAVPGVMVGEKVQVTYNPWAPQGSAIVIERGADGAEVLHTVPLIERTEAGFRTDAAVIGEQWARPARQHPEQAMKADFSPAGGSVALSNAGLNDLDGGTSAAKGWVATSGAPEPENRSCGPDSPPPDLLELVRSGSARSAASALGLSLGTTARLRAGYWPADPRRILQAWSDYRGRTGRIASSWFLRRVQAGGQPFFSTDHPVVNDKEKTVKQANCVGDGTGTVWYLLDTSRVLKPMIYQTRKADNFVAKTAETDDNVFFGKQFLYGVDARRNAGFGFWQLAYASNEELTQESLKAAYAAMRARTGDGGRPLGIRPTLLVVPGVLEIKAKALLQNQLIAVDNGAGGTIAVDNEVSGLTKYLAADWL